MIIPKEFLKLKKDRLYKLTKIKSKTISMIIDGDFVIGKAAIVEILYADPELRGLRVDSGERSDLCLGYIRTSPIVKVLKVSRGKIHFETQGGEYTVQLMPKGTKPTSSRC